MSDAPTRQSVLVRIFIVLILLIAIAGVLYAKHAAKQNGEPNAIASQCPCGHMVKEPAAEPVTEP